MRRVLVFLSAVVILALVGPASSETNLTGPGLSYPIGPNGAAINYMGGPGSGGSTCSNSLDFSKACNSQYVSIL
jgi:hypothetical protein